MSIINLNNHGKITIKDLKAVLDKYPEDWNVSICGESDAGVYVNYDNSYLYLDNIDWLEEEFGN